MWTNHTKAGAKVHLVVNAKTRTPTITRIAQLCTKSRIWFSLENCCKFEVTACVSHCDFSVIPRHWSYYCLRLSSIVDKRCVLGANRSWESYR